MKYQKYVDQLKVDLTGKVYVVTGANSGIGFELSKYLMYLNATVIFACRSEERALAAINQIKSETNNGKAIFLSYDQANLAKIKLFAEEIIKKYQINGLICNAGIYYPKPGAKTADNLEMTIGTNYFGEYYLISLLYEYLKKIEGSRIVIVSSLTAYNAKYVEFDQIEKLSRNKRYGYSKLLLSMEAYELSKREEKIKIRLTHPGVCSTNILFNKDTGLSNAFAKAGRRFLNIFTHSAKKAALTTLQGVISDDDSHIYIKPRGLFAISGYPKLTKIPKKYHSSGLLDKTSQYLKECLDEENSKEIASKEIA